MAEATVVLPPPANAGASAGEAPAGGAPAPVAGASPTFAIPDAYKDRPYLKGIDSQDKLMAMLDGAQTLIGKRPAGIPAADAPKEEWDKFYDAAGRPKTAADYKFEIPEGAQVDEKFVESMKGIMHKYGLNPIQALGMQKDTDALIAGLAKEKGVALRQQNTDFAKLATTVFGATADRDIADAKELLDKFTPPSVKGELTKLSNENLIVLASVLKGVRSTYIKQDGAPTQQPISGGQTPESIRAKAMELMKSPAYLNSMDPGHDALVKQVTEMYRQATGGK